jgi:SAM-dependent methyltransferase
MPEVYDADYFQRGVETGKSCYQNYRWIPELTIPMAMTMIDFLGIKRGDTVLDYGCAFGYLVKAFRLLGRHAFGVDISQYAIGNADPAVKQYCFLRINGVNFLTGNGFVDCFDFCIGKDVFEHISEQELKFVLSWIDAKIMFAVIPLGDEFLGFHAPVNNRDITHVICRDEEWWSRMFEQNGWTVTDFRFQVAGIKDSYYNKYPQAHGFFTLKRG